jgi:hypothetical protein
MTYFSNALSLREEIIKLWNKIRWEEDPTQNLDSIEILASLVDLLDEYQDEIALETKIAQKSTKN